MGASNTIDLESLALRPGEGRRIGVEVDPGDLSYAGQRYAAKPVEARLDVSRMAAGHALRLRFAAVLDGPCMRCLTDAGIEVAVDAREVAQEGRGEELESPYVTGEQLRIGLWAHDALALAVPPQLLCRPDCAGLCAVCGEPLNDAEPGAHEHPREPDPRWKALRGLPLE